MKMTASIISTPQLDELLHLRHHIRNISIGTSVIGTYETLSHLSGIREIVSYRLRCWNGTSVLDFFQGSIQVD